MQEEIIKKNINGYVSVIVVQQKVVVGSNLSSNKSKSCGCLKSEFLAQAGNQYGLLLDRYDAIMRVQYSHLKRRDSKLKLKEKRDILLYDEFLEKSGEPCFYCGLKYSKEIEDRLCETKTKKKMSNTIVRISGIDRVDPKKNYLNSNTVSCCKYCNFAKNSMTQKEFYEWIERVYHHNFIKTTQVT